MQMMRPTSKKSATMSFIEFRVHHFVAFLAIAILLVAGCAPRPTASLNDELPFEVAVARATDALMAQSQTFPALVSRLTKHRIVLDPSIDTTSGQQTIATQQLDKRVTEQILSLRGPYQVLPFQSSYLKQADYLLTGTMAREPGSAHVVIKLALTELKNGTVIAQVTAQARDEGLNHDPLPYYRDSPVLIKDKVIDGYIRTTDTPPGQPADSFYIGRIATATLVNEATELYNQERYQEALGQYRSALAMPTGEQLRVLNGLYLTAVKLGRSAEAEQAFGRVVAMGIAYNELGVKFLFNPGATTFWSDARISSAYPMWLAQIAREVNASQVCVDIVGHTSHTGSKQVNEALSLQRAGYIRQQLVALQPALGPRTRAIGMGFQENLVGSGTDNQIDVLDRRVGFKVVACRESAPGMREPRAPALP